MKRKKILNAAGTVLLHAAVLLFLLLFFSLLWARRNYGNIGFEEIVFHLRMPLQGTGGNYIQSYLLTALLPTLLTFAAELFLYFCPAKYACFLTFRGRKRARRLQLFPPRFPAALWLAVLVLAGGALVYVAQDTFGLLDYLYNQSVRSQLIEEEYVDPRSVSITFPEKKRNLITIFVESAESSDQDIANGGLFENNYIPEMTRLAKENISFSQSQLIEGASVAPACGWTIAGLVAETSGLPLKLYAYDDSDGGVDNSMEEYASFMPGAYTLGQILQDAGYRNAFLAGSYFYFGGRTNYFKQHGDYEIWDYQWASEEGKLPYEGYRTWWGFEDEILYDLAKEQLLELAGSGEPFNFSMLTADTHAGDGYRCELCPDTYDAQYANVWACASAQLNDFVSWIQEQDFYEDTTVVIYGDHSSMQLGFFPGNDYSKHTGTVERKVYNAFINAAAETDREKDRLFTTMDLFPTTLASLGVEIEGDRLGLGTNLFSGVPTLAEEYGYEYLFGELEKRSDFYNEEIMFP